MKVIPGALLLAPVVGQTLLVTEVFHHYVFRDLQPSFSTTSEEMSVPSSFASYLQSASGGKLLSTAHLDANTTTGGVKLPVRRISGSTTPHYDRYRSGSGARVDDGGKVAFVMMNTNVDAHFDIEQTCVPIIEGTLLSFHGGQTKHSTVIGSGMVDLLGPFHVSTLAAVGAGSIDNPAQPTHYSYSEAVDGPERACGCHTAPICVTTTEDYTASTAAVCEASCLTHEQCISSSFAGSTCTRVYRRCLSTETECTDDGETQEMFDFHACEQVCSADSKCTGFSYSWTDENKVSCTFHKQPLSLRSGADSEFCALKYVTHPDPCEHAVVTNTWEENLAECLFTCTQEMQCSAVSWTPPLICHQLQYAPGQTVNSGSAARCYWKVPPPTDESQESMPPQMVLAQEQALASMTRLTDAASVTDFRAPRLFPVVAIVTVVSGGLWGMHRRRLASNKAVVIAEE